MGNPFVHLDLSTSDPAAARAFYGAVFDWKFQEFPQMQWTGIVVGDGVGGGISASPDPAQPTSWTAYVAVDDVPATIARAEAAGAKIVVPHMEVPGMGWLGVFVDPQGATIGVWQSMSPPPAPKAEKKAAKAEKKAGKKAAKAEKKADKKAAKAEKKAGKKAAKAPEAKKAKKAKKK